jgi:hypothetical protein
MPFEFKEPMRKHWLFVLMRVQPRRVRETPDPNVLLGAIA